MSFYEYRFVKISSNLRENPNPKNNAEKTRFFRGFEWGFLKMSGKITFLVISHAIPNRF